jgi:hypothetical protein
MFKSKMPRPLGLAGTTVLVIGSLVSDLRDIYCGGGAT